MLDYIFNICFALTGIVSVRLILEGGVGSSFECVGVALELTLVNVFSIIWGHNAILIL